jgi:shikimate kinase
MSLLTTANTHIVLIGLPGSGKTTIGASIANALEAPFIDLDQEIERTYGKSISEIFATEGEQKFRTLEAEITSKIARTSDWSVVATGGGWGANRDAVAHLRSISRIIYLRVSPAEALRRMDSAISARPLLAGPTPLKRLEQLYNARRKSYEELADLIVDTEAFGHDQLVTTIVRHFSE